MHESSRAVHGVTVTETDPLFPSLVAVIDALPGFFARTSPAESGIAIDGESVAHFTTRPVSTFPLASLRVAVS